MGDRLAVLGARVDAGVAAVWQVTVRATQVERTLAALDPDRVTEDHKRAKRAGEDPELEAALARRFASVQRLLNALDDTEARLRLLDARLGAAVAAAAEVALGASGVDTVEAVGGEMDGVVVGPARGRHRRERRRRPLDDLVELATVEPDPTALRTEVDLDALAGRDGERDVAHRTLHGQDPPDARARRRPPPEPRSAVAQALSAPPARRVPQGRSLGAHGSASEGSGVG